MNLCAHSNWLPTTITRSVIPHLHQAKPCTVRALLLFDDEWWMNEWILLIVCEKLKGGRASAWLRQRSVCQSCSWGPPWRPFRSSPWRRGCFSAWHRRCRSTASSRWRAHHLLSLPQLQERKRENLCVSYNDCTKNQLTAHTLSHHRCWGLQLTNTIALSLTIDINLLWLTIPIHLSLSLSLTHTHTHTLASELMESTSSTKAS